MMDFFPHVRGVCNSPFETGFWKACPVSNCYSMTHLRPVVEGCDHFQSPQALRVWSSLMQAFWSCYYSALQTPPASDCPNYSLQLLNSARLPFLCLGTFFQKWIWSQSSPCFPSLRNHRPVMALVRSLKNSCVAYFVQFSSFLAGGPVCICYFILVRNASQLALNASHLNRSQSTMYLRRASNMKNRKQTKDFNIESRRKLFFITMLSLESYDI